MTSEGLKRGLLPWPAPRAAGSAWPHLTAADGSTVDASVVPGRGAPARTAILAGFTAGWYELLHANGRADRVMWDAGQLPVLRVHGEFGATQEHPYRDRFYTGWRQKSVNLFRGGFGVVRSAS
jgi:hypothetical protein